MPLNPKREKFERITLRQFTMIALVEATSSAVRKIGSNSIEFCDSVNGYRYGPVQWFSIAWMLISFGI